ncbi:hypothetical protein ACN20G_32495 (plasmid) [Streptomyces sp. BI20]|uniref:hypothetical protein n=1 Tax=Streptomyces sp. BI20 TaxID=3403460 RepID=UPI003C77B8BC
MLEWKRINTGMRPVPDPAATPSVWAVVTGAALLSVFAFNLVDSQGDPALDLGVLAVIAALAGSGARFAAAPGTALLCWLILNAFGTPPMGELTWAAPYDPARIGCLLAAAATGTVVGRVLNARAAHRRLGP